MPLAPPTDALLLLLCSLCVYSTIEFIFLLLLPSYIKKEEEEDKYKEEELLLVKSLLVHLVCGGGGGGLSYGSKKTGDVCAQSIHFCVCE